MEAGGRGGNRSSVYHAGLPIGQTRLAKGALRPTPIAHTGFALPPAASGSCSCSYLLATLVSGTSSEARATPYGGTGELFRLAAACLGQPVTSEQEQE